VSLDLTGAIDVVRKRCVTSASIVLDEVVKDPEAPAGNDMLLIDDAKTEWSGIVRRECARCHEVLDGYLEGCDISDVDYNFEPYRR
jgi:hypothetical protein